MQRSGKCWLAYANHPSQNLSTFSTIPNFSYHTKTFLPYHMHNIHKCAKKWTSIHKQSTPATYQTFQPSVFSYHLYIHNHMVWLSHPTIPNSFKGFSCIMNRTGTAEQMMADVNDPSGETFTPADTFSLEVVAMWRREGWYKKEPKHQVETNFFWQ